jgi:hypothetical protein
MIQEYFLRMHPLYAPRQRASQGIALPGRHAESSRAREGMTMISVQILDTEGIVIIEPSGPLEQADFEKLTREVDAFIEEQGVLNGILIHTKSFPGWEDFSGFIQHLQFVKEHHRKIRRVAIVTDSKLLALAPALAGHFVSAELRQFDYQDMDNAKRWVSRAA